MYPEHAAVKTWEKEGLVFSIVPHTTLGLDHTLSSDEPFKLKEIPYYCGYVRFPQRPVKEDGYNGIITYVPTHGGITYAEEFEDGTMVYGFDCAHFNDEHNPNLQDLDYITEECEMMAKYILLAAEFEGRYLATEDRGEIIDNFRDECRKLGEMDESFSMGALIALLTGKL